MATVGRMFSRLSMCMLEERAEFALSSGIFQVTDALAQDTTSPASQILEKTKNQELHSPCQPRRKPAHRTARRRQASGRCLLRSHRQGLSRCSASWPATFGELGSSLALQHSRQAQPERAERSADHRRVVPRASSITNLSACNFGRIKWHRRNSTP